jgi:hypothetical protein
LATAISATARARNSKTLSQIDPAHSILFDRPTFCLATVIIATARYFLVWNSKNRGTFWLATVINATARARNSRTLSQIDQAHSFVHRGTSCLVTVIIAKQQDTFWLATVIIEVLSGWQTRNSKTLSQTDRSPSLIVRLRYFPVGNSIN